VLTLNFKTIACLLGGFSNQLIIYAAARRLELYNEDDLVLDHAGAFTKDVNNQLLQIKSQSDAASHLHKYCGASTCPLFDEPHTTGSNMTHKYSSTKAGA